MTDSESGDSSGEDPEGSKVRAWDLALWSHSASGRGKICSVFVDREKGLERANYLPRGVLGHSLGDFLLAWLLAGQGQAGCGYPGSLTLSCLFFHPELWPEGFLACDPFLLHPLPSVTGP